MLNKKFNIRTFFFFKSIDNRKIKVKVGGKETYSLNIPSWFRLRASHLETFQNPGHFIQEGTVF